MGYSVAAFTTAGNQERGDLDEDSMGAVGGDFLAPSRSPYGVGRVMDKTRSEIQRVC